jgi:hypothetical protein
MRQFIRDANPTMSTRATSEVSLAEAVETNPRDFEEVDYVFIAIGDTPSELWYDQLMQNSEIKTPSFFLWVEPYLAGGHCVYIDPADGASLSSLFSACIYQFNVIARNEYESRTFTKREAGCQTSYVPYSSASVVHFLSSVYPEIMHVLRSPDPGSRRMTWIGDIPAIRRLGLSISSPMKDRSQGTLVTQPL